MTLKTFTDLTHKMRLAQERYFDLAKEARKTGIHKKEQKDALVISKNLEKQVDAAIQEINKALATAPDPKELMGDAVNKLKSSIDNANF